jgi:hypothetical protein
MMLGPVAVKITDLLGDFLRDSNEFLWDARGAVLDDTTIGYATPVAGQVDDWKKNELDNSSCLESARADLQHFLAKPPGPPPYGRHRVTVDPVLFPFPAASACGVFICKCRCMLPRAAAAERLPRKPRSRSRRLTPWPQNIAAGLATSEITWSMRITTTTATAITTTRLPPRANAQLRTKIQHRALRSFEEPNGAAIIHRQSR